MSVATEPLESLPVLAIENLTIEYRSAGTIVRAVDGVSIELMRGESLGIVGESGCGKSTLARSTIALLPEGTAHGGRVSVGGIDVLKAEPDELAWLRAEWVSLVFQDPGSRLDPLMTVESHILELIRAHRPDIARADAKTMAAQIVRSVGLPASRLGAYPHELSIGMKQRLMIGMSIALRPALVVADEPTAYLDTIVEAQTLDLLRDLQRRYRMALLVFTHDVGAIAETCQRTAVMYGGRIVEQGPTKDVFARPQHPYTRALLASTIRLGAERLSWIEGSSPSGTMPAGCRFHPRCPHVMPVCAERDPLLHPVGSGSVACFLYSQDAGP